MVRSTIRTACDFLHMPTSPVFYLLTLSFIFNSYVFVSIEGQNLRSGTTLSGKQAKTQLLLSENNRRKQNNIELAWSRG